MNTQPGRCFGLLLCGLLTLTVSTARAQTSHVAIPGLTGTLALPDNVDKFYEGVNRVLVKTSAGINRIRRKTRGAEEGGASLDSLRPGTPVVVQYSVKGIRTSADELNAGIVTTVDRNKKRVTVRFDDGTTETLRVERHGTEVLPTSGRSNR